MNITVKTTHHQEVLDITNDILENLDSKSGAVLVHANHTTCAITTADLDPGTDKDMLDAIKEMIPKLDYRHPHDPSHVWSHIASSLIGPSVTIPVVNNELQLGTWQRVVLVELDGPRERSITVQNLQGV